MTTTLRLIAERSLTYAPHHVAERCGFFEDEDLWVVTDMDSGPGGSWLADRVVDGRADVARGGVWLPMLYRQSLGDLQLFCLLCDRNAQALMSRTEDEFRLANLEGRTVLLPSAATSQWMFLEGVLHEAGVEMNRIRFVRDLELSTMVRLWCSGFGDYLLVGPPVSEGLIRKGYPIAATLADLGGRVPWSVYYTTGRLLSETPEVYAAFTRAILRAQAWVQQQPAEAIADVVAPDFPEIPRRDLEAAVARMVQNQVWVPEVRLPSDSLARYQRIIAAYGLVDHPVEHDTLVADVPAARVIEDLHKGTVCS